LKKGGGKGAHGRKRKINVTVEKREQTREGVQEWGISYQD